MSVGRDRLHMSPPLPVGAVVVGGRKFGLNSISVVQYIGYKVVEWVWDLVEGVAVLSERVIRAAEGVRVITIR